MSPRPDVSCADCGRAMKRGTGSLPAGKARCHPCRRANPQIEHGYNGYRRACRCDVCRAGAAKVAREYAAMVKARDGLTPTQKYRTRTNATVTCSDCGARLITGGAGGGKPPRCRTCGRIHQERVRKGKLFRRRAAALARTSAQGTTGVRVWVQGSCLNCGDYFVRKGASSPYCSSTCRRKDKKPADFIARHRRLALYERDGWTCQLCSGPVDPSLHYTDDWSASLDHIIPRSRGGSHDEDNLRLAHRWCNSVRGDETYYTDADLAA